MRRSLPPCCSRPLLPARAADTVTANDTALFLAGMMPSADSPLTPLTKDPAWQRHAKFFDTAFAQLEQRQLSKIRAWADANLAAPRPTMFYMFSGPDFLYADAFYSKATTYVLSALEPPGSVPDLTQIAARRRRRRALQCRALAGLDPELQLLHHQADEDRSARRADQRHLADPLRVPGALGQDHPRASVRSRSTTRARRISPAKIPGKNATRGVRIMFAGSDGEEKTLYYFSTDLSNSGVKASGFLKFCATLAPGNSLIKSASYLLHSGNFTTVRDFLLANSATIIQDDSGIPLAYYNPRKWRFFPFGRYAGPIDEFPGTVSGAYAELFRRAQPMDFGIGYRWRTHESNLLLSVRLPDDGSAPPSTATAHRPSRRRQAAALRAGRDRRRRSGRGRYRISAVLALAQRCDFTSERFGSAR